MKQWKMTFGLELEIGDVPRKAKIPKWMGEWDWCELDVVNSLPPFRGKAADPLGIDPPVGGEVKVAPAVTPAALVDTVGKLLRLLRRAGGTPTAPPTAHLHPHVRVKGLRKDIRALKKLTRYVGKNQQEIFKRVGQFQHDPRMSAKASRYLKLDGARTIPDWMVSNIVEKAKNFDDFIDLHCCGIDGVSRGRPFRYGINMYCMKHMDTIEFRFFRATVKPAEILSCIEFCEAFLKNALGKQRSIGWLLESRDWEFPPFVYDHDVVHGWEKTRHKETRCAAKRRVLHDI